MKRYTAKLPYIFFMLSAFLSIYLALTEEFTKGLVILVSAILGVILLKMLGLLGGSIIFLLILYPLNIAYQIPFFESSAYVSGIFVNYLAPTLFVQDLAIIGLFLALVANYKKGLFSRSSLLVPLFFIMFWILHNAYFRDLAVFINSSRILFYLLTFFLAYNFKEEIFNLFNQKAIFKSQYKSFFIVVLILIMSFQLFLAAYQVQNGADLGLYFLGESDVAAGMVNSSTLDFSGALYLRGYGTFPHPNLLGGFAALVFLISSIVYWFFKNIQTTIYFSLVILSSLLALLSFSQGAWLVMILGAILIGVSVIYDLFIKNSSAKLYLFTVPFFSSMDERSITERMLLNNATVEYLKENLLWGVGSGQFVRDFYPYAPEGQNRLSLLQPVHNIFILMLVEYGVILGGVINIGLLLFLIYRIIRSNKKVAVLVMFLFILLLGMVDHYLITLPQGLIMILTALLIAASV